MGRNDGARRRRAAQGYRMALTAAVLLPLWLIVGSCMALCSGFCSDWGDDATCAAQRRSNGVTAALGFALIAALLVGGLVWTLRNLSR